MSREVNKECYLQYDSDICVPVGKRSLKKKSILFVSETNKKTDASRFYRCHQPAEALSKIFFASNIISISQLSKYPYLNYDIIIFSRTQLTKSLFSVICECRKKNILCLYDVDDLIFDSEHFNSIGAVRSGALSENDSVKNSFDRRLSFLLLCDGAITTTYELKDQIEKLGLTTLRMPNKIDKKYLEYKFQNENPEIIKLLYMSGTYTHGNDFNLVNDIIFDFIKVNKDKVHLTLMGEIFNIDRYKNLSNTTIYPRLPYNEMMRVINEIDICLFPLENTVFNDSKSVLKWIECGAKGKVLIASNVREYSSVIDHGINGFLVENDSWSDILESLLLEDLDISKISKNVFNTISNEYTTDTIKNEFCEFILSI
ncbi:MAG: glycosyltransferase family 4 protein [Desulfobacterales bacterium]|nr:glycosyltransferase family 4 protein [Desulfobacterales bacterium]